MVVNYDGIEIQFPSNKNSEKSIYVNCKNGKYSLSSFEEFDKENKTKRKSKENIASEPELGKDE